MGLYNGETASDIAKRKKIGEKEDILDLKPKALRMHFTIEDGKTVRNMLELYEHVFCTAGNVCEPDIDFTRGHFRRGIK